jgi:hypothetical protein
LGAAEGFRRFASGVEAASQDAATTQPGRTTVPGASLRDPGTASAHGARLHEGQNGFRPERSCADHQFTLHQVLSGRRAEDKESFVLFVDVTKAFPTVWLDGLWQKMWEKGVNGKCFRVLHSLYQGAQRVVSHDNVMSDVFSCDLGLHEGDPISPTLFLFFIDDLLKEICDKHPGVHVVDCSTGVVSGVVAAMQADDLVVVCDSITDVQAVADTIYSYSKKWRFNLNSKKSAVMHVPVRGRSDLSETGIVWNGVPVPVAYKYCYLGLWFCSDLSWNTHFDHVMQKVQKVTKCYMPLWKSRHISVEVKRIVLLSCVRPIIEYGSEVWLPSKQQQDKIDSVQTEIIKVCMHMSSYKPCSEGLLAEWGLKPMHMWLHQRVLMFNAKLHLMPEHRMPKIVFNAVWCKNNRPIMLRWQKYVEDLKCKYGIVWDESLSDYGKCMSVVKQQVKSVWHDELSLHIPLQKSTLKRFVDWVRPSLVQSVSVKSCSPYLRRVLPSFGVEVLMRIRLSCLPVHAHTFKFVQSENERSRSRARRQVNDVCPVCLQHPESLSHFVFDCAGTQRSRSEMYDGIRGVSGCGQKLRECLAIDDDQRRVYRFVSDDVWGSSEALLSVTPYITAYLGKAWKIRNSCKHNRGRTAGVDLVVSASEMGRGADGIIAMADG